MIFAQSGGVMSMLIINRENAKAIADAAYGEISIFYRVVYAGLGGQVEASVYLSMSRQGLTLQAPQTGGKNGCLETTSPLQMVSRYCA